jgi:Flp pilus assembly protein CpaB
VELTGNNYSRNDWRKLLSTRRGTIIVATVCALVAGGILIFAMQSYRHNVDTEGNPETVFVASGLIQKGTAGDAISSEQLFKPTSIATKQVSAGAIADTAQLHGKVAAADIYPGQQLTAADFTAGGGLPAQLAPNQRAMTITLGSAHGMVGQLHDGDHVDVYASVSIGPDGRGIGVERLLMSNIQVLKAGTSSGGGLGGGTPQSQESNVTLKVDNDQAGVLAYAAGAGTNAVWLVLRPANATSGTSTPTVSAQSLLLGSPSSSGGAK